jgi:phytoene synthase
VKRPTESTARRRTRGAGAINRAHGTTYYWSTTLLPADRRPHVHALYAFCRYADDIVDDLGDAPVERRRAALAGYGDEFRRALQNGSSDHDVLAAVVDTVASLLHRARASTGSSAR